MQKFSKEALKAIKSLAVNYAATVEAVAQEISPRRDNVLLVHGRMLLDVQERIGIVMCEPDTLKRMIKAAEGREDVREREKAAAEFDTACGIEN